MRLRKNIVNHKCSEVQKRLEGPSGVGPRGFYEIEIVNESGEDIQVYLEEDTFHDSFQEFWIRRGTKSFRIFPYAVKYYKFDVGIECSGASGCARNARFDGTDLVDDGSSKYVLTVISRKACLNGPNYDDVCKGLFPSTEECGNNASPRGTTCQVGLHDNLNDFLSVLEVTKVDGVDDNLRSTFKVSSTYLIKSRGARKKHWKKPWVEYIDMLNNGTVATDAGVPDITCKKLQEQYVLEDDNQLTWWFNDDKYPCNAFGKSLIWFMASEWFYYG